MCAEVAELCNKFKFSLYTIVNKKEKFVLVLPEVRAPELDKHLRQSSVCGLRQLFAKDP